MDNKQINREVIVFCGVNFIRYPDAERTSDRRYFKGRWRINGKLVKTYLHRVMWIEANGPIPESCHIHHKDGDYLNNLLSNFECITSAQHLADHYHEKSEEWRQAKTHTLLTAGQDAAKLWHKSDVGREWHRQNAQANKDLHRRIITCIECGTEAITTHGGKSHFCGDRCRKRSAARTFRNKHKEELAVTRKAKAQAGKV